MTDNAAGGGGALLLLMGLFAVLFLGTFSYELALVVLGLIYLVVILGFASLFLEIARENRE